MKFNLTLLAAALAVAACAPKAGKTTQIVGQFTENAPETVRIVLGETVDTTVTVTDGRFQVAIPKDLTDFAYLETDFTPISFISDGSKITVDPMAGTAVSSNKKGAQAHYAAYNAWMEKFMADYRAKIAEFGEDEEAAEKYFNGIIDEFNAYQKETAQANLDNIVGLMAISQITEDDPAGQLDLLNSLSDEMKAHPQAAHMLASFETLAKTGEGQPFVDFTVVEEPAAPEASTVKFSDYVGNGKYVLVDFWASWCGPCNEEMPNLKNVYERFKGDRFELVGIAVSDKRADTEAAVAQLELPWPIIYDAQSIPSEIYGVNAIPHIILFGPDGKIVARDLRGGQIGELLSSLL